MAAESAAKTANPSVVNSAAKGREVCSWAVDRGGDDASDRDENRIREERIAERPNGEHCREDRQLASRHASEVDSSRTRQELPEPQHG